MYFASTLANSEHIVFNIIGFSQQFKQMHKPSVSEKQDTSGQKVIALPHKNQTKMMGC